MENKRRKRANTLHVFRKIHRTMGAFLFIVFLIVSCSGLLLGWKKHSNGLILPISKKGTSTNLADWLSIDSLHIIACKTLHDSIDNSLALDLERIDARPQKGMIKFVFIDHYWGIQLDGATGEVLQIARRRHDIVENIHDGSILDYFFNTSREQIKLIYTSIVGLALFTFSVTGFWLWFGPKVLKGKSKK